MNKEVHYIKDNKVTAVTVPNWSPTLRVHVYSDTLQSVSATQGVGSTIEVDTLELAILEYVIGDKSFYIAPRDTTEEHKLVLELEKQSGTVVGALLSCVRMLMSKHIEPKYVVLTRNVYEELLSDRSAAKKYVWRNYETEDGITRFRGIPVTVVDSRSDERIIEVV